MSDSETEVHTMGAGASMTEPVAAGQVKKGGYIVLKGHPCKVTNVRVSRTGKHGHAKCNFTGTDIFTGQKVEEMHSSTHNVEVPIVTRTEYELTFIEDGHLHLMDDDGAMREDIPIPSGELGDQVQAAFDDGSAVVICCVVAAMGEEHVMSFRTQSE